MHHIILTGHTVLSQDSLSSIVKSPSLTKKEAILCVPKQHPRKTHNSRPAGSPWFPRSSFVFRDGAGLHTAPGSMEPSSQLWFHKFTSTLPKAPNLHLSLTTLNFLHITVTVVQPLSDHFVNAWTVARQTLMGFSRQEYWGGLPFPFPGDLPNPGTKPASPALAGGFFITEPVGKPSCIFNQTQFPFSLKKEHLLLNLGVS